MSEFEEDPPDGWQLDSFFRKRARVANFKTHGARYFVVPRDRQNPSHSNNGVFSCVIRAFGNVITCLPKCDFF